MPHRPRVLVVSPWYEPAFKAGGVVRAVVNMVEALAGDLDISVVTSDRDLGDERPYPGVEPDRWAERGGYRIWHLPPSPTSYLTMARLVRGGGWDAVHINGLFSPLYSTLPLVAARAHAPGRRPRVVLQSHGMLGEGALRLKARKKRVFLDAARAVRLYGAVVWHATSELEADEVRRVFGDRAAIEVASNVPDRPRGGPPAARRKRPGEARFCFFSRVSPKKGLLEAIRCFARSGVAAPVVFDVIGPIEDAAYWEQCERELEALGGRLTWSAVGAIPPERVQQVLSGYHFMVLPTYNENFGYAILDALQAGCPVILSDQTPWRDLPARAAGWTLPLADPDGFARAIDECIQMDAAEYDRRSRAAYQFALDAARDPVLIGKVRAVLVGDMIDP